ncbi:MAG: cytochrome P450 [Proteobacteria bacterium]|nr:cytochrome P450 [Pseudomonadota bacterium]
MVVDLAPAVPRLADIAIGDSDDALSLLERAFRQAGDAFRAPSSETGRDLVVLSHPDHVRHVLVDRAANYVKGVGIERVAILLGKGLMTSEGALWRADRRALQPAFHRSAVAAHATMIVAANERLVTRWRAAAREGRAIDVTHETSALTLEIVLRAIFSDDYERLVARDDQFALLTVESERDLRFAYAFRQLAKVIGREIAQRRTGAHARRDMLQTLVDARDRHTGAPLDDRQLLDEVMTLIVAGHETTASALQWLWYLVTRDPATAAALHAEAQAATTLDPASLPLASAVIAETLRLYPPGWMLTRRALADVEIGHVAVRAGEDVLISPYLVHRHPQFWPDPERFDPSRFAPGVDAQRARFTYLPFGLGPRACIGEPMALLEMLIHVAVVARAVALTPVDPAPVAAVARVNLRPRRALTMRIQPLPLP